MGQHTNASKLVLSEQWTGSKILLLFYLLLGTGCAYSPTLTKGQVISQWKANQKPQEKVFGTTTPQTAMDQAAATALAKRSNRTLMDLRARVPMSQAGIELAAQWNDPELRITDVALDHLFEGEPTLELALRFPILQPGTLSAKRTVKVLAHRALMARIHAFEHRLAVAVKKVFHSLALIQLDRDEVDKEIKARQDHVDLVKRRLEAGVGVEVDLALATLPHARALDERELLVGKAREQRALLARLLGLPNVGPLKLPSIALQPPAQPKTSDQSLVEKALTARPELEQAILRLEQAKTRSYAAKQRQWPWPDFAQLSYEVRHPLQPLRYGLALAVKIPVFEWVGNRVTMHEAEVTLRKTEKESVIRSIERQVRDARSTLERLRERLQSLQTTLIPATDASSEAVQRALQAGTLDPLRATVVEGRRIRAKRRYLKVLSDFYDALHDLEEAVGPGS